MNKTAFGFLFAILTTSSIISCGYEFSAADEATPNQESLTNAPSQTQDSGPPPAEAAVMVSHKPVTLDPVTLVEQILLRARNGVSGQALVATTAVSQFQSDGDLEVSVTSTISPSIWWGRVRVTVDLLNASDVIVKQNTFDIFSYEGSEARVENNYWFPDNEIASVERIRLAQRVIDYDDGGIIQLAADHFDEPTNVVFILPGLLGDSSDIQRVKSLLEQPTTVDSDGSPFVVKVWDWTDIWPSTYQTIQERIQITCETRRLGTRFANEVRDWRNSSTGVKHVHLIGLSAGSMIAKTACEASSSAGKTIDDSYFKSIVFLSGALDVRESWADLDRASDAIYVYYSYADQVLASRFPTFLIFRIRVAVAWPACGGVGLKQRNLLNPDEGFDGQAYRITLQLPFVKHENGGRAEELGNNGGHLSPGALAVPYFTEYILPLFTGAPVPLYDQVSRPDGWSHDIHPDYRQDQTGWGLPGRELVEECSETQ